MYYIINENKQIIASDNHFLEHCNVSDITALNKAIFLEKIHFEISTEETKEQLLTLHYKDQTSHFKIQTIEFSSLIGSLSLIVLSSIEKAIDNDKTEKVGLENLIIDKENNSKPHIIEKEQFTQKPITQSKHKNIVLNITEVSQEIGISENDYTDFFNDYISTALSLKNDLEKHADPAQTNAIETLNHLINVLHLDFMQKNILGIQNASAEQTSSEVASLYELISRITLQQSNDSIILDEMDAKQHQEDIDLALEHSKITEKPMLSKVVPRDDMFDLDLDILPTPNNTNSEDINTSSQNDTDKFELDIPLFKSDTEASSQEEIGIPQIPTYQASASDKKSLASIDLSTVVPMDFHFSLSTAAEDLSLPENLIIEFMLDFIQQVHEETIDMLEAYKNADLPKIQKIAHLLKGVSSNLRITTLADTQYKIQFCHDLTNFESLLKEFWAHFLSFETKINALTK